jgi:hypothetical protein
MFTPGTLELFSHIPMGVMIAFLFVLVACYAAQVLQQVAATIIALFSKDQQRANHALRVLGTLRGLPDHRQNGRAPRIDRKRRRGASTRRIGSL